MELSAIATQGTISRRQHPVEDEADPEVIFNTTWSGITAAVGAKSTTKMNATRGGISMVSA